MARVNLHFTEPEMHSTYLSVCERMNIGFVPDLTEEAEIREIPLHTIRLDDPKFESRKSRSENVWHSIMKKKRTNNNSIPLPIVCQVGRRWYYTIDGKYRLCASRYMCDKNVKVRIYKRDNTEEAQWLMLWMHCQTNPQLQKIAPELYDFKSNPRNVNDFAHMLRTYMHYNPNFESSITDDDYFIHNKKRYNLYELGVRIYGPCVDPSRGKKNRLRDRIRCIISGDNIKRSRKSRKREVVSSDFIEIAESSGEKGYTKEDIEKKLIEMESCFHTIEKEIKNGKDLDWNGGLVSFKHKAEKHYRILGNLLKG